MYALFMITVFMNTLSPLGAVTQDLLIAAVIGRAKRFKRNAQLHGGISVG